MQKHGAVHRTLIYPSSLPAGLLSELRMEQKRSMLDVVGAYALHKSLDAERLGTECLDSGHGHQGTRGSPGRAALGQQAAEDVAMALPGGRSRDSIALDAQAKHLAEVARWADQHHARERAEALRGYLSAVAARDASVLIALRRMCAHCPRTFKAEDMYYAKQGDTSLGVIALGKPTLSAGEVTNFIQYRLSIIDLDRKPAAKIPKHAELDEEILAAVRRERAQA